MNKLTAEEILTVIKKTGIPVREFAQNGDCYADEYEVPDPDKDGEYLYLDYKEMSEYYEGVMEQLGGCEEVDQFGGEGQGDEWYSIKYFPAHDVYIRTDGCYTSYYGTDFEEGYGYEVKPEEKVITVYNKVN